MSIFFIVVLIWLWFQLILASWVFSRARRTRLYFFDPISLAIYIGITLVTASIQARLNRKNLRDFQGIPTNDETRPIPYIAGSVEISAPALLDFGDFHRSKVTITEHLPGFLHFLSPLLAIFSLMPMGYRYYCGFDFGLCHGPGVTLKGIRVGDKQVYSGVLAGGTGVVAQPGIFGLEGGTYAVFDFYTGSNPQLGNAYWASQHTRVPGYSGVSHLVWRGPSSGDPALGDIKFSGYVGRTPVLREFKFQLERIPDNLGTSFALVNGNEANFAEVLYELYTDESLGIGAPPSTFDLDAWRGAAEILYDEGLGCTLVWDNSSTVGDVINHLRDTIDCMIYSSLDGANAGKLTIKLIRDDYVVNDLIEVSPENASDVVKFTNRTVDDVPNEIKVSYTDIAAGYVKGEAVWQSLANRQLGETRNTIETDYPVGNSVSASKLATRDGLATVLPLKDVQLKANRQTSRLGPGSVFKFSWSDYDVQQIILRVNNIVLENLDEPTVILECLEDRFSLGESAFGTVSTRTWVDPTSRELQDNLVHTVINQTTTAPPLTPTVGNSYIVATGGTGAWSGKDACLATWNGTEWIYVCGTDLAYTVVYDANTQTLVGHDGSGWTTIITSAYKTIQDEGVDLPNQEILNFIGGGVVAEDDPDNSRTNVLITGGVARLLFEFGDGKNSDSLVATMTSRFPDVPAGTITKVRIEGDATGSAVVDIQTSAADPPSYASICASAKPTLSSDKFNEDSTLTGWTVSVAEGTKAKAVLESVSGINQVAVVLTLERD